MGEVAKEEGAGQKRAKLVRPGHCRPDSPSLERGIEPLHRWGRTARSGGKTKRCGDLTNKREFPPGATLPNRGRRALLGASEKKSRQRRKKNAEMGERESP